MVDPAIGVAGGVDRPSFPELAQVVEGDEGGLVELFRLAVEDLDASAHEGEVEVLVDGDGIAVKTPPPAIAFGTLVPGHVNAPAVDGLGGVEVFGVFEGGAFDFGDRKGELEVLDVPSFDMDSADALPGAKVGILFPSFALEIKALEVEVGIDGKVGVPGWEYLGRRVFLGEVDALAGAEGLGFRMVGGDGHILNPGYLPCDTAVLGVEDNEISTFFI